MALEETDLRERLMYAGSTPSRLVYRSIYEKDLYGWVRKKVIFTKFPIFLGEMIGIR